MTKKKKKRLVSQFHRLKLSPREGAPSRTVSKGRTPKSLRVPASSSSLARAMGSKGIVSLPAPRRPTEPLPRRVPPARASRPAPADPGDLPLPPGPTSTAPGRRRRPRPSGRGAIGQRGRHSRGRALPTPPSLPPSHSTLPGRGKTAVGPGWQPTAGGERRGEERGAQEGAGAGRARAEGNPAGPAGAAGTRWRRWRRARREAGPRTFPPPHLRPRGARPARSGQRLRRARLRAGRGVEERERGEGRARPGPLCKAPAAAAAATAPWQR